MDPLTGTFSLHSLQYKQGSHKQGNQEFEKVRLKQDLTGIHLVSVGLGLVDIGLGLVDIGLGLVDIGLGLVRARARACG